MATSQSLSDPAEPVAREPPTETATTPGSDARRSATRSMKPDSSCIAKSLPRTRSDDAPDSMGTLARQRPIFSTVVLNDRTRASACGFLF
jgi:hypothetical protein